VSSLASGAFDQGDNPVRSQDSFDRSIEQYLSLSAHPHDRHMPSSGLHFAVAHEFCVLFYTPSIWPVLGTLPTASGERMDPFSGEGAFHTAWMLPLIMARAFHSTADGIITGRDEPCWYGRLVVIDHGLGITTFYAPFPRSSRRPGVPRNAGKLVGYP